MVTLHNCKEMLATDRLIQLSFIYSYRSRKYWEILRPVSIQLSSGEVIVIPKGFVTDLSSVPRFLWAIFPPFGDFLLAALIHDYLYVFNVGTRKDADREMLIWSNVLNDHKIDNKLRYYAVRLFGQSWWLHQNTSFQRSW